MSFSEPGAGKKRFPSAADFRVLSSGLAGGGQLALFNPSLLQRDEAA